MTIKPAFGPIIEQSKVLEYKDLQDGNFYKVVSIDYYDAIVLATQPDYKTASQSPLVLLVVQYKSDTHKLILGKSYASGMQFEHINVCTPITLTIG